MSMLKQREGVENEGYNFETSMLSFYCFTLTYNATINNFKIAINDNQHHPFDDIVIDITTTATRKYVIQLKHVKDQLQLNANHFGKKGKMDLKKYFKYDFGKSNHVVLLTNGLLKDELKVCGSSIKIKANLTQIEKCLDTSCTETNHVYEICDEENLHKIVFYTAQRSIPEIDEVVEEKMKQLFFVSSNYDLVQKFKKFLQDWKKGSFQNCKLDKQDIRMKIAEILFFDHILCYQPSFSNPNEEIQILQNILNDLSITLIEDLDEEMVNRLANFDFDRNDIIESEKSLILDHSSKKSSVVLWRLKKFPLIININQDNKQMICEVIKDLQNESLSFMLIGNISKNDIEFGPVFQNLSNLKQHHLYQKTIEKFKVSIQGQPPISLEQLIFLNENFLKIITLKELLSMSENFIVGDVEDSLPEPYIPRKLKANIIKANCLEKFPHHLFIIDGEEEFLKSKFPKWKFWTSEEKKEIYPPKSIILCEEKNFSSFLMYKDSNVHCLKHIKNDYFKLICSKEEIEQFSNQFLKEEELHDISQNLNLICGGSGMGKLTLLKYLRKSCPVGFWTVKIDLEENASVDMSSFDFKAKTCFEEMSRVMYFFCGFDNIQNSLLESVEYIKQLSKTSKVWIFSEDHLKETLEKLFQVSAMQLLEFCEKEQILYLEDKIDDKNLERFKIMKNNILATPMHLYMLKEIFTNDSKAKILMLTDIYRLFIKTKYQLYFQKIGLEQNNQILENGIYYRNQQYQLAALTCLNINIDLECDQHFFNQISIGDIIGICKLSATGKIVFSQQSYADYFAAHWLSNNIQKIENKMFLFEEEFRNILFMFNLEVCKTSPSHIDVLYQNLEQLSKEDLQIKDKLGRSLLHLACSKPPTLEDKHKEILQFLLSKPFFDPLERDAVFKLSVLDYSIRFSNLYVLEEILVKHPHTFSIVSQKLQGTKLDMTQCVKYKYKNLLKLLTKIQVVENQLLYSAVKGGDVEVVSILIENGADINFILSTHHHRSVLHLAAENNLVDILRLLLSRSANVDIMDRYRNTPLHLAAIKGALESVKILLDHGCDINFSDNLGQTALQLAARYQNRKIYKFLLGKGANQTLDKLGRGIKRSVSGEYDEYTTYPLHWIAFTDQVEQIETLLKANWDINQKDQLGRTPLYKAIKHKSFKVAQVLINKGADVNTSDNNKVVPLCRCIENQDFDLMILLLKHDIIIDTTDVFNYTPLHWAVMTGNPEIVKLLLTKNPDIDAVDNFGRKPVDCAVENGNIDIVTVLTGDMAVATNRQHYVQHYTSIPPNINNCKLTSLQEAVDTGNTSLIKKFLMIEPNIDVVDSFGYSLLHRATFRAHKKTIQLLLENAVDTKAVDSCGCSVLHWAAQYCTVDIARLLIRCADVNAVDSFGYTALEIAAMNGNTDVLLLILESGGALDVVDQCGNSPLDWACKKGYVECVELLKGAVDKAMQEDVLSVARKQKEFCQVVQFCQDHV